MLTSHTVKTFIAAFVFCIFGFLSSSGYTKDLIVGDKVPTIKAIDSHGKKFSLADHKGKYVALEWSNHQCPFVRKHYDSGNMQKLQQFAHNNDIVWVTVLSSAKGKQGNVTGVEADKIAKDNSATPDYILLDASGKFGRAMGAKTTPHMMLIKPDGTLFYNGAIDSINSIDEEDIDRADKYFLNAMTATKKSESLDISQTKPYGCSIKY